MKRKTITLSEHLGVTAEKLDEYGVLNTNLGIDTKLFIDPKLLKISDIPEFKDAAERIRAYFARFMQLHAQAKVSKRVYDLMIAMIAVKEPKGLAIGYGDKRDTGTAIALSVANQSVWSLEEMLRIGINDTEVMEMLGLFVKNFGADSISDLMAHIIYQQLCEYTQRIALNMGVDVHVFTISESKYRLPRHPYKNSQIIFVPMDILNELPLATEWSEVADAAAQNERVRRDFNNLVGGNVKDYAAKVKKSPEILLSSASDLRTLLNVYREVAPSPYNKLTDPLGAMRLNAYLDEISGTIPAETRQFTSTNEVYSQVIQSIIPQFRRHIEELGANKMLYQRVGDKLQKVDDTKPIHEEAAQVLFHGIADQVCAHNNIMLSRESKTAPGAVDFSLGTAYDDKVIVEIKKSNNKNLLEGYKKQLVRYERSEAADKAVYVVVIVHRSSKKRTTVSQLDELKELYRLKQESGERCPTLEIIDGLIYESASKV